jgi:hypothetical protein
MKTKTTHFKFSQNPKLINSFPAIWFWRENCTFNFLLGGALENWPKFQTTLILMKLWDLLDNMCVVVDLKFEQKIPPGSASSSSKTR